MPGVREILGSLKAQEEKRLTFLECLLSCCSLYLVVSQATLPKTRNDFNLFFDK
jgi:hypothetical protein